jgi:Uri superfamily endonuclease
LKGSYILNLYLKAGTHVSIGRLGIHPLKKGHYLYTGSAMGPGGLNARLGHHRAVTETPHWHVDYLRRICRIRKIWFLEGSENMEHQWSDYLSKQAGSVIPIPGFGSSDCTCPDPWIREMGRITGIQSLSMCL